MSAAHMHAHLLKTGWKLVPTPAAEAERFAQEKGVPIASSPVVLNAWSPRLGSYAMNGKTFVHARHGPCFLHAHKGSQHHAREDCPCPVEASVFAFLNRHGYTGYYAFQRPADWRPGDRQCIGVLRKIAVADIARGHLLDYEGRRRYYPPSGLWQALPQVRESAGPRRSTLYYDVEKSKPIFAVEYIPYEINLEREG